MNRILVIAAPSSSAERVRAALSAQSLMDDVEAFVVVLWLPRPVFRIGAAGRYWRRAHARLDELLRDLDEARIQADGIVTDGPPQKEVPAWLSSFRPRTILIACDIAAGLWSEASKPR